MVALTSIHSMQKALWAYMQRGGRESSIKGQAGGQNEGLMALMASTFDGRPEELAI